MNRLNLLTFGQNEDFGLFSQTNEVLAGHDEAEPEKSAVQLKANCLTPKIPHFAL